MLFVCLWREVGCAQFYDSREVGCAHLTQIGRAHFREYVKLAALVKWGAALARCLNEQCARAFKI